MARVTRRSRSLTPSTKPSSTGPSYDTTSRAARIAALASILAATIAAASTLLAAVALLQEKEKHNLPIPTSGVEVSVYNKVTDEATSAREGPYPAYLSKAPQNACLQRGCDVPGTRFNTGDTLTAVCAIRGDFITNGIDSSPADDANPNLYSSNLWYGARASSGQFGYLSEVWIQPNQRGGAGLRSCDSFDLA
jgi:hypothetical protein